MTDAERVTCPRCGAPLSADVPVDLCPRCLLADPQGDKTEIPPVSPSSPGRARRKLTLASAVSASAAILLGALWFGNRPEQPADAKAEALLERGAKLHRQGKLEEAIAAYREAIRIKPDLAEAYGGVGAVLQAQGKMEEASAEYRTAIRLMPADVEAHTGPTLNRQEKPEEEIAELRTVIRLKPDDAIAHYNLGNALSDQGKLDEAIAEYRTVIRLKPADADAHYCLGTALHAQGKLEQAVAELRTAIRVEPDSGLAQMSLALALVGSPNRPRRDYRRPRRRQSLRQHACA